MPIELSTAQEDLATKLSEHAKDACELVGLTCKKCEPKNFYLTVYRYYGKVQGMTAEMDRCIDWLLSKGKRDFTVLRFNNWCAKKLQWQKEEERKVAELNKLKSGTEFQRAEHARRVGSEQER